MLLFLISTANDPGMYFERELDSMCRGSLSRYGIKYQNCAFRFADRSHCIIRRAVHIEHCNTGGERHPGEFHDEFNSLRDNIVDSIENAFRKAFVDISPQGRTALPTPAEASRQRERVLGEYSLIWRTIKSNKTCFACLYQVPDHVLRCGHSYCDKCVSEYGSKSNFFEYGFKMYRCVLCQISWQEEYPTIRLKPKCAGVRVLTLDGGGIRGIMELALLQKMVDRLTSILGDEVHIREFFDLIMGTSTGKDSSFFELRSLRFLKYLTRNTQILIHVL